MDKFIGFDTGSRWRQLVRTTIQTSLIFLHDKGKPFHGTPNRDYTEYLRSRGPSRGIPSSRWRDGGLRTLAKIFFTI